MSDPQERWSKVAGYETHYEVSTVGRIRRIASGPGTRAGRILKGAINSRGYVNITLSIGGALKIFLLHQLVARAFIGRPEKGQQVNHKDGNKAHNHLANIEYVSAKENTAHAYRTGLRNSVGGRLSPELKAYIQSKTGQSERALSRQCGVSRLVIKRVRNNFYQYADYH